MTTPSPATPCPLCGAADWRRVLVAADLRFRTPGAFPLARCRACGLYALQPPPSPDLLAAAYPPSYTPHHVSRRRAKDGLPPHWEWLSLRSRMRVLDVGCGGGRDLDRLRRLGCDAWGIEPDPRAAEAARSLGLRVHAGTLDDAPFPPPLFDAVGLVHAIEHVRDPVGALRKAGAMLAPGGRLAAVTPNADAWSFRCFREAWVPLDAPRHLHLFTPRTLAAACRRAGLRVEQMRVRPQTRTAARSLERTNRRILAAAIRVAPAPVAIRALGLAWATLFRTGEELTIVARKA